MTQHFSPVFLSISHDAKPWKYHLDNDTLRNYAYPLHSMAYAILESHKGHQSNYKFPIPPNIEPHIKALESALQVNLTVDHLAVFHSFIYPFLSYQPSIVEDNKWSMFVECWLAIHCLHPEGHFWTARELTGLLAKLEYHCRGITLYESYLRRHDFPNESWYA